MRLRTCRTILIVAVSMASAATLQAEIKAHRLFSDNMILQRDRPVAVWGTSDAVEAITVKFGEQSVSATLDNKNWKAELAPLAASSEPRELTISQGDQTLTFKNVLVGDIWLCGGQSNMQWEVHQSTGGAEAIASSATPKLRLFAVARGG